MKLDVVWTSQFKKDYKLAMKGGQNINLLDNIIRLLAKRELLPGTNRDHTLSGNWIGHRECHILPDWLLIYRIDDNVLVLTFTRPELTAIYLENEAMPYWEIQYGVLLCLSAVTLLILMRFSFGS